MQLSLSVAAFFELFWLDLIPAGTFIPPNTSATTLSALTIVHFFGFTTPAEAIFPILFCLPLGWGAARLEYMHRVFQNASYNALQTQVSASSAAIYSPGRLVGRSILQACVLYFVFFEVTTLALVGLTNFLLAEGFLALPTGVMSWGHLWIAASIGPLLSLRSTKAYAFIFAATAVFISIAALYAG